MPKNFESLNILINLIKNPLGPIQERKAALNEIFAEPFTIYLCRVEPGAEPEWYFSPTGEVHARASVAQDPRLENSLIFRRIQASYQSDQVRHLFKHHTQSKCSTTRNLDVLTKPFNETEQFFHGVGMVPVALLFGYGFSRWRDSLIEKTDLN